MQLEHATIPPYLVALYSIHHGTNADAVNVLRVVAVEEMLHLTLAANILNAVGGTPCLTDPGFVPSYPAYVPDGETDFLVDLQPFSKEAVRTFMKIERPVEAPSEDERIVRRHRPGGRGLAANPAGEGMHYFSIGEFYMEIVHGLKFLHTKEGDALFSGDPSRQVEAEHYYSAGNRLFAVTDINSAVAAAKVIIGHGEGFGGTIYDRAHELAHFYRFEELLRGRHYQAGDKPHTPTGPVFGVQWDAVYPIKKNAQLSDYPESSELHAAAAAFNSSYADFLGQLTTAYNGQPQLLLKAIPQMFALRNKMVQLIHHPIPGMDGVNAGPTFEITGIPSVVSP
jgi:hypothetical protein